MNPCCMCGHRQARGFLCEGCQLAAAQVPLLALHAAPAPAACEPDGPRRKRRPAS